ncbi:MAG: hypothetical protein KY455_00470 [Euryarchaeota archaeon]|nr:hypothetical protein [Euryarchaeota archaeon]
MVATAELGKPLDLAALEGPLEADPYDPERFPGLVIRDKSTTFLLFGDGSVRITGPKGTDAAKKRLQSLTERLTASGVRLDERVRFWVENLVVSTDLGASVPLDQVVLAFGPETTAYQPDRFPGLVHRPVDPPVTILVFSSGRIVATGLGDLDRVRRSLRLFIDELRDRGLVGAPRATGRGDAVVAEGS